MSIGWLISSGKHMSISHCNRVFTTGLFFFQVSLLFRYIVIYIKLFFLFHGKIKVSSLESADRSHEEQQFLETHYRTILVDSYQQIKHKFHAFFIFCISILLTRMFLYIYLRVDDLGSISNINVWKTISPDQHYYFYLEEAISNIGILWYFFYLAQRTPEDEQQNLKTSLIPQIQSQSS